LNLRPIAPSTRFRLPGSAANSWNVLEPLTPVFVTQLKVFDCSESRPASCRFRPTISPVMVSVGAATNSEPKVQSTRH
jgi:hypothetical protein